MLNDARQAEGSSFALTFRPSPSPQQSPFTTAFVCLLTLVDFAFIVALEAVVTVCQDINLVR